MSIYQLLSYQVLLYYLPLESGALKGQWESQKTGGQGPRYTVLISTNYVNEAGSQVSDSQELQFGSESAVQAYARRWVGQEGVNVEIKGPPMRTN